MEQYQSYEQGNTDIFTRIAGLSRQRRELVDTVYGEMFLDPSTEIAAYTHWSPRTFRAIFSSILDRCETTSGPLTISYPGEPSLAYHKPDPAMVDAMRQRTADIKSTLRFDNLCEAVSGAKGRELSRDYAIPKEIGRGFTSVGVQAGAFGTFSLSFDFVNADGPAAADETIYLQLQGSDAAFRETGPFVASPGGYVGMRCAQISKRWATSGNPWGQRTLHDIPPDRCDLVCGVTLRLVKDILGERFAAELDDIFGTPA